MAAPNKLGNTEIAGTLAVRDGITFPAGSVRNADIQAAAGISASKLQHRHQITYGQPGGAVSITERKVIHVARAAATVNEVAAGSRTANVGAATISVEVLKNGTTILTAPIVLDSANTAYVVELGTLASASLVAGDVLEVSVTSTAGGGTLGQGAFVSIQIDEAAS